MEALERNINKVQSDLLSLTKRFQSVESNAKATFASDVDQIRKAVSNGNSRIGTITTEGKKLMLSLEDAHIESNSPDLSLQVKWFQRNVNDVVASFQKAEKCADSAMSFAMTCRYNVQDIYKDVEYIKVELDKARLQGNLLSEQAQANLDLSLRQLSLIQTQIQQMESQIQSKSSYCNNLRSEIRSKETAIAELGRKISVAKSKKDDETAKSVVVGVTGGILGISMIALSGGLLAPFVGGIILGGAGTVVVDSAVTASDLKKEIEAARLNSTNMKTNISQAEAEVSRLQAEKNRLDSQISQQRIEAAGRQTPYQASSQRISRIKEKTADIKQLEDRASSTSSLAQRSEVEFQTAKEQLEGFTVSLNANSTELRDGTSFLDVFVGETTRRKRRFEGQKRAILRLSTALEQIQGRIPALLSAGTSSKLLEFDSRSEAWMDWDNDYEPMPALGSIREMSPIQQNGTLPWLKNTMSDEESLPMPGAFPS